MKKKLIKFLKNKLIDYLEFKKIYPSKLKIIIYEKEPIAIINHKQKKNFI